MMQALWELALETSQMERRMALWSGSGSNMSFRVPRAGILVPSVVMLEGGEAFKRRGLRQLIIRSWGIALGRDLRWSCRVS